MNELDVLVAVTIHLVIPILGLLVYLTVFYQMRKKKINTPPNGELLLVVINYVVLTIIIATGLFWKWSAMASLGFGYAFILAPIIMGVLAYQMREKKNRSKYHKLIYVFALLYFIIAPLSLLITVAIE